MYITIQQDMRATMLQLLNAKDDTSALDPYLQTPAEQLSGLYNSGIVATSGSVDA